ncbi:hypothetical protein ACNQ62_05435 [Sulfitobacter sp. SBS6]|uniref:hypothetical protein n=1 Tax=Sulfitobacter sp. SBS6 TaxID=3401755 RepID=UPI003AAB4F88
MTLPVNKTAKLEALKLLAMGGTMAKKATIPQKKPPTKTAEYNVSASKAANAKTANEKWERPNLNALCRKLAGEDMAAGLLLAHILYIWRNRKKKLERHGLHWLAHKREAWAKASGLTFSEFRDRALPRLRKECQAFLTIKAMGNGPAKMLWISVDEETLMEFIKGSKTMDWEMFWAQLDGVGVGFHKSPNNYYSKDI